MTFNIWLGGDVVDSGSVIAAIQGAHADIVGLQEAEGNTRKIAQALGWPYWSDRLHVVSRYPLIDPPVARGEYVLAQERLPAACSRSPTCTSRPIRTARTWCATAARSRA